MEWYWIALIAGLTAPWVVIGRSIMLGFSEKGLQGGFGAWFGASILTVPLMLLLFWLMENFVW